MYGTKRAESTFAIIAVAVLCALQIFEDVIDNLEQLIGSYKSTSSPGELDAHPIYKYKVNHLSMVLKRKLNVVAKFTRNFITDIVNCKSEEIIRMVFR